MKGRVWTAGCAALALQFYPGTAFANLGFVMPPISVRVMVWVLVLSVTLSILSGEALMKAREIRDQGEGDLWFRVLGVPAIVVLATYVLLRFAHVMTGRWIFPALFAALAVFQFTRLHSFVDGHAGAHGGKVSPRPFLLPAAAAITLFSPVLFWFTGGMTHLLLQLALTVFWTSYGCRYGAALRQRSLAARPGSYSSIAMRTAGAVLVPASIIIAVGFSYTAYRAFQYSYYGQDRWTTARSSVDVMRSALAAYAADSENNRYPVGELGYGDMKVILSRSGLPWREEEAMWVPGSFHYSSKDGTAYTIEARASTRQIQTIKGTPEGISPERFPY